jgi:hypothetical protein
VGERREREKRDGMKCVCVWVAGRRGGKAILGEGGGGEGDKTK